MAPTTVTEAASLYTGALTSGRAEARARFLGELKQSLTNLQDLLAVDDAKQAPASADRVAASLGTDGARFLSVSRLMAVFARRSDKPAVMDPDQRRRCEGALAILEAAVRRQQESPAFRLFHGEQIDDPCTAALECCEGQLRELLPVLRAVRIARLEAVSAYDAPLHDEALERFDWETAEAHEIAAMTVPIAVERSERLSLNSFSKVLLSGKPVQVLISWSGAGADAGAIALAHRAAFVLKTSMARQDHLSKGFAEMAQTLQPAVAVVSVPPADFIFDPLYRYDPEREGDLADRFELCPADNSGFDALLLSPSFREQCRVIPPDAPEEGLMELGEYLKKRSSVPASTMPFILVTGDGGETRRIAVTREIVRLCLDRSRAWEMLTALAAKPQPARDEAAEPAEVNASAGVREAAAKEAYMRVIALLANPENLLPPT